MNEIEGFVATVARPWVAPEINAFPRSGDRGYVITN